MATRMSGLDIVIAEGQSNQISVRDLSQRLEKAELKNSLLEKQCDQFHQYILALEEKMNQLWDTYPMPGYQDLEQQFDNKKRKLELLS